MFGKISDTQAPHWPCCWNLNGDFISGPTAAIGETIAQGASGRQRAKPCPHWTSRSPTTSRSSRLSMPSAQTVAPMRRGEAHERLHQGHPGRVGMDALDQVAIELDDVGLHPHHLLQARVARARRRRWRSGRRGSRSSATRPGEGLVVGNELVLGDLDHEPVEVGGEHLLATGVRAERRGADVESEVGRRWGARPAQRGADRRRVELRPEAAAVSRREPRLRRASRRPREACQRLVSDQVARWPGRRPAGRPADRDRAR